MSGPRFVLFNPPILLWAKLGLEGFVKCLELFAKRHHPVWIYFEQFASSPKEFLGVDLYCKWSRTVRIRNRSELF